MIYHLNCRSPRFKYSATSKDALLFRLITGAYNGLLLPVANFG